MGQNRLVRVMHVQKYLFIHLFTEQSISSSYSVPSMEWGVKQESRARKYKTN